VTLHLLPRIQPINQLTSQLFFAFVLLSFQLAAGDPTHFFNPCKSVKIRVPIVFSSPKAIYYPVDPANPV
jgi:hypothetical protein